MRYKENKDGPEKLIIKNNKINIPTDLIRPDLNSKISKTGKALTICTSAELRDLKSIERLVNHDIKRIEHKYPMVLTEVKPPRGGNNNNNNKKSFSKKRPNSNFGNKRPFKPQNKNYKSNR